MAKFSLLRNYALYHSHLRAVSKNEGILLANPKSRHPWCQAHYLRNLVEPLADVDAAFNGTFEKPSVSSLAT